ncbi:acetate/propionate family kinase [Haloferula sp.]|uniref:acetate/propionate family kinase n=1 Tax=Haloferula sp. TaxID=2497595 RepID=UPI003C7592D9
MLVLIANLGSTSFKYRLYDMAAGEGRVLAKGGFERVEDHGVVIEAALKELEESGAVGSRGEIDAVGFKTVLGRNLSGCVEADEQALAALDGFAEVAPAHNPPYAAGIRQFARILPDARLVALFETAFYQWMPEKAFRYAVPQSWFDAGIRRYGFHGASHKFVAERSAELLGRDDVAEVVRALYQNGPSAVEKPLRVISCHLGGSSSVTGIRNGVAIGTSMGFSPQSGLPQNNRVGDLDSGAIPYAAKALGLDLPEIERQLTKESGLLGVSGVSNDLRDIEDAAGSGNVNAQLAIDMLIHETRRWASSFLFDLGGLDGLVFTAGIGENGAELRAAVCEGLEGFGLKIDSEKNAACKGEEMEISTADSAVKVFVIPANEELVLAREVTRKISSLN